MVKKEDYYEFKDNARVCTVNNNSNLDIEALAGRVVGLKHLKMQKSSRSIYQVIKQHVIDKKQEFLLGDVNALPENWGITSNSFSLKWYELTDKIYHAAIRMDIEQLVNIHNAGVLLSNDIEPFYQFLAQFRQQCHLLMMFKDNVQDERMVYGFFYKVTTDYSEFYYILDQLIYLCKMEVENNKYEKEYTTFNDVMTSGKANLLHHGTNGQSAHQRAEINHLLIALCDELTRCLDDEQYILQQLLQQHFNEIDEHASILATIADTARQQSSSMFIIQRIIHAMYTWLHPDDRKIFIHCFPTNIRWRLHAVSSKQLETYQNLLHQIYAPQISQKTAPKSKFKRLFSYSL